jgi:hypothetical protein
MIALATRICLISLTLVWYFTCHYYRPETRETMYAMTSLPQFRSVVGTFCLALGLTLSQGCARSEPSHPIGSTSPSSEQKLPFHANTDQASAGEGVHPAVSHDLKAASALPFGPHAHVLPPGTLLTVQLDHSLSTAKVRAGDTFTASIAAPLAIDGDALIERGASTVGHVESVRAQAGSSYFQLTLNAITVEGRPLALQTSSLFARGTAQPPDGFGMQKGRRLTFRLRSPVTLDEPKSVANRQPLASPSE